MLEISQLPAVNATLNGIATVFLLAGYILIRTQRRAAHRACMLAAFATSTLFLVSYLVYHANAGSRPFPGEGWARVAYLAMLISHVGLAAVILPLALVTLSHGLRSRFDRHVRLARWTLPIWLYVSVTGVLIYVVLYQVY